jgi:hypothetical protein
MESYSYRGIITTFEKVSYSIQEAKLCYGDGEGEELRIIDTIKGDWGDIFPMIILNKQTYPLPIKLNLRWITLIDLKCYETKAALDTAKMEMLWEQQKKQFPDDPFKYVVVGIAPYGGVAIWLRSKINAVFVQQLKAEETEYDDLEESVYSKMKGDDKLMASVFPKDQLENVMKQYTYRYLALEEYFDGKQWKRYENDDEYYENIDIDCVEDKRMDGTFDFTDGDSLYKYHTTGMPKRVSVRWTENDSYYVAHFWLDTHYVTWFFETFHKRFPETPIDLLVRLDTRANQYEVAMTAEDLIPRAFVGTQYIILKNFAEISRSEYFDKEKKEWDLY